MRYWCLPTVASTVAATANTPAYLVIQNRIITTPATVEHFPAKLSPTAPLLQFEPKSTRDPR